MNWLVALAACTIAPLDTDPGDTHATDTDTDPCEALPTIDQSAYLCMPWSYFGAYDKSSASGHFEAWGSWDEVRFVEDDGTPWEVWLWGSKEGYAAWPAISDDEPVTITQVGDCDPMSGPYNGIRIDDAAGEPILMQGARSESLLGDWRVLSPEPAERCPRRTGDICFETVYNRQLTFEHGDESWTLWHGESVSVGALDLRVNLASGNEDPTTNVTCAEIQGGTRTIGSRRADDGSCARDDASPSRRSIQAWMSFRTSWSRAVRRWGRTPSTCSRSTTSSAPRPPSTRT